MRDSILICVQILLVLSVQGQQLTFNGYAIDTIKIVGSSGHYHFDKKQTYSTRSELYVLTYNESHKKYTVTDHSKIFAKNDTLYKKISIRHIKKSIGKIIADSVLSQLMVSLLKYDTPTFASTGLTLGEFISLTSEAKIKRVAKLHGEAWQFKRAYSIIDENRILFKACQNIDTFNLFLSKKFVRHGYVFVSDYHNSMGISIVTKGNKTFFFEGVYPNEYKQPWYEISGNVLDARQIINLKINKHLVDILPPHFYGRSLIHPDFLVNRYIEWYLQRKRRLSEYLRL